MQLLHLYIGDIGRNIVNQDICFSNEYKIEYSKEEKKLHIFRDTKLLKNIYGRNILGIDLLVGRNGSGKTTIMNLLGLCEVQRRHTFPVCKRNKAGKDDEYNSWFAVYHLKNDLFCIEGYNPGLLSVLSLYSQMHEMNYTAVFRFDIETQDATFLGSLDRFKYPHTTIRAISQNRFLHYTSRQDRGWYSSQVLDDEGAYRSFPRYHITSHTKHTAVFKYLCESLHDRHFKEIMEVEPKNAVLTIELKNPYGEFEFSQREDEFSKCIYGDENLMTDMPMPDIDAQMGIKRFFSCSQSMVLRYLEILIAKKYDESGKNIMNKEKFTEIEDEQLKKYLHRKDFLLVFLRNMMEIYIDDGVLKRPLLNRRDWDLINLFCEGLEEIDDKYYVDGCLVRVPLIECTKNVHCLDKLMSALDENSDESTEHEINNEYYIRPSYHNLSSGEMDFIHLYASIKTGIDKVYGTGTCVLLLDEPDAFFHPEWSRRFVESITKVLQSKPFRKFYYQVFITTHSPILLADVPREHIHCMSIDKDGKVNIRDAKYGFLSNINTILLDSMFVKSSFGSFAEKYANSILKKLNEMDKLECNDDNKQMLLKSIRELEESMCIIKESVIQKYIERKIFSLREKIYNLPQNNVEYRIRELMDEIRNLELGRDFND